MTDKTKDTPDNIRARVEARVAAEDASRPPEPSAITPEFVRECFWNKRRGDGTLFAALHAGLFLNNKSIHKGWLCWGGHSWNYDILEKRYIAVRGVINEYKADIKRLDKEIADARINKETDRARRLGGVKTKIYRRIDSLNDDGADKCLLWAHRVDNSIGVLGECLDRNPWLLACENGVLELRTGRFRSGRPTDHITKAVPHKWLGIDTPAPHFTAFLNEVFDNDSELIAYVNRLFGYGITGLTQEHILPVLHGTGRNGKGTLVETLRYVLGDLAQPIQSEMLLDQRYSRSASGPSPDIMKLKGLRVAFASETDENRRFSTSKAKWLSGGDSLTGRNPHDPLETTFTPTHLLCLLTNHLPHAPGDDFAFWARLHLVPFNLAFVDNPQGPNERKCDKALPDKLKAEAPGILAWLMRGCLEWQRCGLDPPLVVRSATEQYRVSEDTIAEFIEACCYPPSDTDAGVREKFADLYGAFEGWYIKTCGDKPPKKKKFSTLMEKRFRKEKAGGHVYFYGISLTPENRREP